MRVFDRENQLPPRHATYDFICPECRAEYLSEGQSGLTITCPNCYSRWRVKMNGHPRTQVIGSKK